MASQKQHEWLKQFLQMSGYKPGAAMAGATVAAGGGAAVPNGSPVAASSTGSVGDDALKRPFAAVNASRVQAAGAPPASDDQSAEELLEPPKIVPEKGLIDGPVNEAGLVELQLAAFGLFAGGEREITQEVAWSTSNPTISVSPKGIVSAPLVSAKAVISAKHPRSTVIATAEVEVAPPKAEPSPTKIVVYPPKAELWALQAHEQGQPGRTKQFKAFASFAVKPSPREVTNKVAWSSDQPDVLNVNSDGLAQIPSGYGSGDSSGATKVVKLTAMDRESAAKGVGIGGMAEVTVKVPVLKKMIIHGADKPLDPATWHEFTLTLEYSNGFVPLGGGGGQITWTSDNEAALQFDGDDGRALAKNGGAVKVTATYKPLGRSETINLTVKPRVSSVKVKGKGKDRGGEVGVLTPDDFEEVPSDPDDPDSPKMQVPKVKVQPPPMPKAPPAAAEVLGFLRTLKNSASIRTVKFGQEVHSACATFEDYAKNKVPELAEGNTTAASLFGALTSGIVTAVGAALPGVGGFAAIVIQGYRDVVKGVLVDQVKSAAGPKNDSEALLGVVAALSKHARDLATVLNDRIDKIFAGFVDPIISKVEGKQKLTKDEEKLIYPYVGGGNTAQLDALCESLGLPSKATSKAINIKVYSGLVRKFEVALQYRKIEKEEEELIVNRDDSPEQREKKTRKINNLQNDALQKAKKNTVAATKQRREELEKAEGEMR